MCQLDEGVIRPQNIVVDINLCYLDFPFALVWFGTNPGHWHDDLVFELRSRQVRRYVAARVLCGWHYVELFASRPRDSTRLYVGVNNIGWAQYTLHLLFCVPAPPIFTYYGNLALLGDGRFRHSLRTVALT